MSTPKSKSFFWSMVVLVVGIAIIVVWQTVIGGAFDKAHADTVSPTPTSQRLPVHDPSPDFGSKMAHLLITGHLGSSVHRHIGARLRRHLNTYRVNHYLNTGKLIRKWWADDVMGKGECILNTATIPIPSNLTVNFCLKYGANPAVRTINRELTYIKVVCGGEGIVGGVIGARFDGLKGAFVGVVASGAQCVFSRYANMIFRKGGA